MTLREIALFLAAERKRQGISQKEMARRIGVTQSAVSHLEHVSDSQVVIRALMPYAKALGFRITFSLGTIDQDKDKDLPHTDSGCERQHLKATTMHGDAQRGNGTKNSRSQKKNGTGTKKTPKDDTATGKNT